MSLFYDRIKNLFPFLAFCTVLGINPVYAQTSSEPFPAGSWIGSVNMGEVNPRLIFEISSDNNGRFSGHVGSPDSGANGIPISNIEVHMDSLFIEVSVANASFKGVYHDESSSIVGVWQDGSSEYELVLSVYNDLSTNLETARAMHVRRESTHFSFNFANDDTSDYSPLIDHLEQKYLEIVETLSAEMNGKIEVNIYPSINLFHQAIFAPGSPDWLVGAAGIRQLKFVSPFNPGPAHSYNSIIESAVHELIHTIVLEIHDGDVNHIPMWLNEGFAYYQAGQFTSIHRRWVAETFSPQELPTWDELAKLSPVDFGERHGYELSGSIVDFLAIVYGNDKVTSLIYSPSDPEAIFGKTQKSLEDEWRHFITTQRE